MKRNTIVLLVLGIALLIIIGITIFGRPAKENYIWEKTLETDLKQPYNLGVTKKLLQKHAARFTEVHKDLKKQLDRARESDTAYTYVFAGENIYLTTEELQALLDFAAEGNEVFIASESLPDTLVEVLNAGNTKSWRLGNTIKSSIRINFNHEKLKSKKDYRFAFRNSDNTDNTDWYYITEGTKEYSYYEESIYRNYAILSSFDSSKTNFIKIPYETGTVYIHSNPLVFTNYMMLDSIGFSHANKVFSHARLNHILWDEASRHYKDNSKKFQRKNDSPLSYILKQPALAWAWYMLLFTALLFLVFRSKRQQRVIPVLEQNRNTSLQFLGTMSGMFFQSGNHSKIAEMKMANFLWFVRNRMGIPTHEMDDRSYALIASKARVNESDVRTIFEYYEQVVKNKQIDSEQLIKLHQLISVFYRYYYKQ